jgi:hypothetical protein
MDAQNFGIHLAIKKMLSKKRSGLSGLDRNLFDIPAAEIGQTQVLQTILEGQPVFQRG